MTFALTKFQAYGVEISEPLQKRFIQRAELDITAANTDTAWDFGAVTAGGLGTFWTAVGGTVPGSVALKAMRDIALVSKAYLWGGGLGLTGRTQIGGTGGSVTSYDSSASAGGATTEALTVTGLATTDTILAVSQLTKGANSTAFNAWTDTARTANTLTVSWTANPGAGSIARVLVRKASAAVSPVAGQYSVILDSTNTTLPDFTFPSGSAPTVAYIILEWEMKDGEVPIYVTSP